MDYAAAAFITADYLPPVLSQNATGPSPFVLVCDHASNRIPAAYGALGLSPTERLMHIAWDPGALAVARRLSSLLDAPLVHSTVSRLVIDCNRDHDAPDLVATMSERTEIAANRDLPQSERAARVARYHAPFHYAIEALLDARQSEGRESILVTVHSFTPVYHNLRRPWPIGLIHGADERFAAAVRDALTEQNPGMNIGWNEPYSAFNGVTYTLERHGDRRQLPGVMIEIRHDEILTPEGVATWAGHLSQALQSARAGQSARPATRPQRALAGVRPS